MGRSCAVSDFLIIKRAFRTLKGPPLRAAGSDYGLGLGPESEGPESDSRTSPRAESADPRPLVQAQVDLAIAVRNVPLAVAWLKVGYYYSGQVPLRRRQDSDSEADAPTSRSSARTSSMVRSCRCAGQ